MRICDIVTVRDGSKHNSWLYEELSQIETDTTQVYAFACKPNLGYKDCNLKFTVTSLGNYRLQLTKYIHNSKYILRFGINKCLKLLIENALREEDEAREIIAFMEEGSIIHSASLAFLLGNYTSDAGYYIKINPNIDVDNSLNVNIIGNSPIGTNRIEWEILREVAPAGHMYIISQLKYRLHRLPDFLTHKHDYQSTKRVDGN